MQFIECFKLLVSQKKNVCVCVCVCVTERERERGETFRGLAKRVCHRLCRVSVVDSTAKTETSAVRVQRGSIPGTRNTED